MIRLMRNRLEFQISAVVDAREMRKMFRALGVNTVDDQVELTYCDEVARQLGDQFRAFYFRQWFHFKMGTQVYANQFRYTYIEVGDGVEDKLSTDNFRIGA